MSSILSLTSSSNNQPTFSTNVAVLLRFTISHVFLGLSNNPEPAVVSKLQTGFSVHLDHPGFGTTTTESSQASSDGRVILQLEGRIFKTLSPLFIRLLGRSGPYNDISTTPTDIIIDVDTSPHSTVFACGSSKYAEIFRKAAANVCTEKFKFLRATPLRFLSGALTALYALPLTANSKSAILVEISEKAVSVVAIAEKSLVTTAGGSVLSNLENLRRPFAPCRCVWREQEVVEEEEEGGGGVELDFLTSLAHEIVAMTKKVISRAPIDYRRDLAANVGVIHSILEAESNLRCRECVANSLELLKNKIQDIFENPEGAAHGNRRYESEMRVIQGTEVENLEGGGLSWVGLAAFGYTRANK